MASRTERRPTPKAASPTLRPPARHVLLLVALTGCVTLAGCGVGVPPQPMSGEGEVSGFAWPIAGPVSSPFGPRGRTHHDGIDIAVPRGTEVHAAGSGVVIFSGALRGYGNTVIVEHASGITTVYAHLEEIGAATGARVRRGDNIGTVGETGRTTGPNLHFEVRRNRVARDPLAFLPERKGSVMAQREKPAPKRAGSGG